MIGYSSGILSQGYGIIPRFPFKDERLDSGAKLVYACLSSYGGGNTNKKEVWPSISTLCRDCKMTNKTIIKHLKTLEEYNYITITKHTREDGGTSNNVYILNGDPLNDYTGASGADTRGLVENFPNPSRADTRGLVESLHTNNNNKTITKNNNNKTNNNGQQADQESAVARFEKLWAIYPKKARKKDAFNAYKRAIKNGVTDEEIKKGIENYKAQIKAQNTQQQYIAQGGTWFNQERWNDEYETHQTTGIDRYMLTREDDYGL